MQGFKNELIRKAWSGIRSDTFLFVYYPFCSDFCSFCIYRNSKYNKNDSELFLKYYDKEISLYADILKEFKFKNIHIGGGTPNLIPLNRLVDPLRKIVDFKNLDRFVLEVYPTQDLDSYLKKAKKLGVTKVQLGIQSTDQKLLGIINRKTSKELINKCLVSLKNSGLLWSVDLVYGFPRECVKKRVFEIKDILKFKPSGFHLYLLARRESKDLFNLKKDHIESHNRVVEELNDRGYKHVGDELCRGKNNRYALHTICYDHIRYSSDVLALGLGGDSSNKNAFYKNVKSLKDYSNLLERGIFPILNFNNFSKKGVYIIYFILRKILYGDYFDFGIFSKTIKDPFAKKVLKKFFLYLNKTKFKGMINGGVLRVPNSEIESFLGLLKKMSNSFIKKL